MPLSLHKAWIARGATLLWVVILLSTSRHEFHVSITTLHHDAASQSIQVTSKLFTDDLERSLQALGAPTLRLGDPREYPLSDSIIFQYLQNRLRVEVDGREAKLQWVGKEIELDATWCYLELTCPTAPKSLRITNRILTETFDDQSNITHIEVAGDRQSLLLHGTDLTGVASF